MEELSRVSDVRRIFSVAKLMSFCILLIQSCLPRPLSLFKFCLVPLPPPTSTFAVLFVAFFLTEWVIASHLTLYLLDIMDLQMSSLGTFESERTYCVFYPVRCQVYLGLAHEVLCYYSNFVSHIHKKTHSIIRG